MKIRRRCKRLGCAAVSVCAASISFGQVAKEVARRTLPSVVLLVIEDSKGHPVALGSGFMVRPGVAVTNLHVIRGAARARGKIVGRPEWYESGGTLGIDRARAPHPVRSRRAIRYSIFSRSSPIAVWSFTWSGCRRLTTIRDEGYNGWLA
jgi:hypothetical protein